MPSKTKAYDIDEQLTVVVQLTDDEIIVDLFDSTRDAPVATWHKGPLDLIETLSAIRRRS